MREPQLHHLSPKRLKPYLNNARTHSKAQIAKLKRAIGIRWTAPIIANDQLDIISGHGRWQAATELGLETVPVVILEGLTSSEEKVLRLAENEIARQGGMDMEVLKAELESIIDAGDIEITDTGFEIAAVDAIVHGDAKDAPEESVPAVPVQPVSRAGDVWVCTAPGWRKGDPLHRLGCGDSLDAVFVRRVVGRRPVDVMFTDAPYNLKVNGQVGGKGKVRHAEFAMGSGEMNRTDFVTFLRQAHAVAVGVSRPGAVHFSCMSHHYVDALFEACEPLYDARLNLVVWAKSNAGMGSLYRSQHELIAVYRVPGAPHFNAVELGRHGRNRSNVWRYEGANSLKGSRREDLALHPTVKSCAMTADAILDVSRPGDLVLDLFTGSGTTLLAATRTGRCFRGTEIAPGYVDLALQRWAKMTGGEIRLDATDQLFAEVADERLKEAA